MSFNLPLNQQPVLRVDTKKKAEVQLKLSASRCLGGPSMRPHIAARLEVGVISIWVIMVV